MMRRVPHWDASPNLAKLYGDEKSALIRINPPQTAGDAAAKPGAKARKKAKQD